VASASQAPRPSGRAGVWARARGLAERTPEARNRYVDFLRAASILVVVIGHWLMAAPFFDAGELRLGVMLHVAPWSQWLTWALQVMPIFFVVGGYANAASWEAAQRNGRGYGAWIGARLQRLVAPLLPLLLVWTGMAALAHGLGVRAAFIRLGSQAAMIPTWFLAVYVMVVVVAPAAHWAWRRLGMGSFWALALFAAAVDAVAFAGGMPLARWLNYAFVWLAVHQLGYAWRSGGLTGPARGLPWAAGGLALLIALVTVAGYPVSMISVPGEEVSNSRPPTLALLALGAFHLGILLSAETPLRRWLRRTTPWAAAVLVNGTIMTLYLWHLTVMVLLIGLLNLLGGPGLGFAPGSGAWWLTRPLWILVLAVGLWLFVALFSRFEQRSRARRAGPLPAWRSVVGAVMLCSGIALLARGGIGGEGPLGLRLGVLLLGFAGIALVLGVPTAPPALGSRTAPR
jgi:peptidoglycan/LPS O-acetylase OafA/YrhL